MKAFLIYHVRDREGSSLEPSLFAFTDDSEILEEFKDSRDMSQFYIKEVKNETKEWCQIVNRHRAYMLIRTKLKTKSKYEIGRQVTDVPMTITCGEEETCVLKNDFIFDKLGSSTLPESKVFSDELKSALNTLYYFDMLRTYNYNIGFGRREDNEYFFQGKVWEVQELPNIMIDELAVFIHLYGDTMK